MFDWDARPKLEAFTVGDVTLRAGDRVRLCPKGRSDIFDLALAGKAATIVAIEQDYEDRVFFAVTVDDDPGGDLGVEGKPGHRFFYRPEEVEPLRAAPRILVAGVGNLFLGDDGFGTEVVRRLAKRALPGGVRVVDFGIRGFDLSLALAEGCDGAILVDATKRGRAPGTLYVLDVPTTAAEPGPVTVETHGMEPAKALALASALGGSLAWIRVVGCEPKTFGEDDEMAMGLSPDVEAAVEPAIALVHDLIGEMRREAASCTSSGS